MRFKLPQLVNAVSPAAYAAIVDKWMPDDFWTELQPDLREEIIKIVKDENLAGDIGFVAFEKLAPPELWKWRSIYKRPAASPVFRQRVLDHISSAAVDFDDWVCSLWMGDLKFNIKAAQEMLRHAYTPMQLGQVVGCMTNRVHKMRPGVFQGNSDLPIPDRLLSDEEIGPFLQISLEAWKRFEAHTPPDHILCDLCQVISVVPFRFAMMLKAKSALDARSERFAKQLQPGRSLEPPRRGGRRPRSIG